MRNECLDDHMVESSVSGFNGASVWFFSKLARKNSEHCCKARTVCELFQDLILIKSDQRRYSEVSWELGKLQINCPWHKMK